MKKLFFLPALIILRIPAFAFAQSAKDTYKALKRIEAKVEVGIVYKEYMNILADAQLEVNLYSQSAEFAKETNVISSMETILRHYKLAGMVWDSMITGSPPPPETQKIFEARMQYHWREASMELLQLSQHLKSYK